MWHNTTGGLSLFGADRGLGRLAAGVRGRFFEAFGSW